VLTRRLSAVLATAITVSLGFITIAGLLIGNDLGVISALANRFAIHEITTLFLQLVTITIALTIFPIGILNLLIVHTGRLWERRKGMIYSLVLLVSFATVIVTYFVQRSASMVLLESVQISIESALAGLVLFSLVYGASGIMRRRSTWSGLLFVISILIVLIGALPLNFTGTVAIVRDWLMAVPVNAGARGILLGIALATLVTGIRVLIGQDRSYRE
jgi:hypothetical protein